MLFSENLCVAPALPLHFSLFARSRSTLAGYLGVAIADDWPVFEQVLTPPLNPFNDRIAAGFGTWFGIALRERILIAAGGFYAPPDDEGKVTFGYALASAYRGRGLGLEFAASLVRVAWTHDAVQSIEAHTLDDDVVSPEGFDNRASCAVLRRLGFERIAIESGATQTWRLTRSVPLSD